MSENAIPRRRGWDVIVVIALGGAIGASARYGIGVWWPAPVGAFPWATFAINAVGCALIGVLIVLITDVWKAPARLLRPFAATGILGGFTTFSTYAVDIERLLDAGAAATAMLYLAATPAVALVSVWAAVAVTGWAARRATRRAAR